MTTANQLQTILGSGGSIGRPLAAELRQYTNKIRLVSRNPLKVNEQDELMPADLLQPGEVDLAVSGSSVVYLTVGLKYSATVWEKEWPVVMRNVLQSCKKHKAKLVFFDNVYMYDRNHMSNMTENTPVRPTSRKGKVRQEIAAMLMDAAEHGEVEALIARCADFYAVRNSVLVEMVVKNLSKGKKAMWFANADKPHSITSAEDAAKGTAMLGNANDTFNQVWHLPTHRSALTGRQWTALVADVMHKKPGVSAFPLWFFSMTGLIVPVFRELAEMGYQYDRDYIFNSSKFESKFAYRPEDPSDGIRKLIASMQV